MKYTFELDSRTQNYMVDILFMSVQNQILISIFCLNVINLVHGYLYSLHYSHVQTKFLAISSSKKIEQWFQFELEPRFHVSLQEKYCLMSKDNFNSSLITLYEMLFIIIVIAAVVHIFKSRLKNLFDDLITAVDEFFP